MSNEGGTESTGRHGDAAGGTWAQPLADAVPNGVFGLDAERRVTAVNDALVDLSGHDRGTLVGAHGTTLLTRAGMAKVELAARRLDATDTDATPVAATLTTADDGRRPVTLRVTHGADGPEELLCVLLDDDAADPGGHPVDTTRVTNETGAGGPAGTWEWYVQDGRIRTGPEFAQRFDVDVEAAREGVSAERFLDAVHPDDRDRVEAKADAALSSCGEFEAEYRLRAADGDCRWVVARGHVECDADGRPVRFPGVLFDITERKERERELEQYRTLTRAATDVIVTIDEDSVVQSVNPAVEDVFGYSPAEVEGESLTKLMPDRLTDDHFAGMRRYLSTGDRQLDWDYIELPGQHRDGHELPLAVSFSVTEYEDECYFTGIIRDVTERTEREQELRRYERIVENLPVGVYRSKPGPEGELVEANPALADIFGADSVTEFMEHSASDFYEDPARRQQFSERLQREGIVEDVELRQRTLEGALIWISVTAIAAEEDGEAYFDGIIQDITARKRRERRLEESRRRYETLVEHFPNGAVVLFDEDVTYLLAGGEEFDIFSWDAEDIEGQHPSECLPDAFAEQLLPHYEAAILGEERSFEVEYQGRIFQFHSLPVRDEDGDIFAGMAISQDVTELRERERQLEESRRWHRTLVEHFPNGSVSLMDDDLQVVLTGGEAFEHFPFDPEDLEGERLDEALPADIYEPLAPHYEAALDGETRTFEVELQGRVFQFHVLPVFDEDGDVFACLAMNQDVTEQRAWQDELEARVRQQEVVTDLGQRALAADDLDRLFAEAVERVAETLDTDYCKVLDLRPGTDDLLLRAGVGWREGLVGEATVGTERDSQAGYTLASAAPVVVADLDAETRFSGPELLTAHDVTSGISVVIGTPEDPWGVLGTHDTDAREFTDRDVNFVQSVANILTTAIERADQEQEIRRQRERLAALNHINGVVRDVIQALLRQSTREEIEQLVCDLLADSDSYEFAWVGELAQDGDEVVARAEAGVDGYLDDTTITVDDDPTGMGPTGRAFTTGEVQVTYDAETDPQYEPWQDNAAEYGYNSSAAVPITYENTTYGVLNVYTGRRDAFDGEERAVVEQLGTVMGHAINAIERKRLLMSDEVVEVDFRIPEVFATLGVDIDAAGTIHVDRTVPVKGDSYLVFGDADEEGVATLDAFAEAVGPEATLTTVDGTGRFELRVSDAPVTSRIAAHGGNVTSATVEDGVYRLTAELPADAPVRDVVDNVRDGFPDAEVLAQRRTQVERGSVDTRDVRLTETLTDRQLTALETAYFAGFFEWPRASTGEDVAEAIGVSPPTFHQHLRAAERRVFGALLEREEAAD